MLRVQVEGVDGQVHLRDPGIVREQLGRAAAAVGVEVDHEHAPGARSSAARAASASPLKVQNPSPRERFAWWRPDESEPAVPVSSARRAAATAPPVEAQVIANSPGSHDEAVGLGELPGLAGAGPHPRRPGRGPWRGRPR